ncbi:nuclear transport factor 2 family protein [Microbacterium sp. NIBRBAC000506063]|uniref:nuclear transport factor 2 family protein n=1 Tax=Microbacterium sp. NIBRBAC000506063 TaxID=2734618 RepID=UPI001BB487A5|nr:nuclear transport factor 2 family protein [Microbacterium sp. NIBRBAC000506063]QTV79407.1 hypothetical protein KAE78_10720 [Microbacterium sp. NIBRBAC000506063]
MNTPAEAAPRASRLPLFIAIGTVVVIVVVALVVVLTRGGAAPLDESSPEGVVQRYVQAVIDGDMAGAEQYLHPELTEKCDTLEGYQPGDVRVTLRRTVERGDTATVDVIIVHSGGSGLFGPSEYQSDDRFALKRDGDAWRITETPWEFTICERVWE